jgi:hypothetical protein
VALQVQGFKPRAVRNRLERKAHRRAGEREFPERARHVTQALDGPDGRALHIEPLEAGKVTQELEILRGISEQPQLDLSPAVPKRGELRHLRIGLRLLHAKTDAGFV